MPIEDSDQSAHLHSKSYKLAVCAHRRLRSVCTSSHQKLQAGRMRPSKTQISLHIFTPKVTSWPYASIEDSDQSAHLHSKSYKLAVCAHRRLRSVCTSSQQKLQAGRMRPSKTQISLHIFTAKVTSWPYASIEDSDQSAYLHTNSYKLAVCAHRRLSSDCTSSHQKLQVYHMCPSKTQFSLHIAHKKYKMTECTYRRLRSVCTSSHQKLQVYHMCPSKTQFSLHIAHKKYKMTECTYRRLRSVCTSSQQKLQVGRMRPSKTQFRLHIVHQKLQVGRMCPSKTQFRLHIFTAKVTSWPYASIEDSDQTAHRTTKSYKLAVCAHRRLSSDCTSSQQKLQVGRTCPSKTQFRLHVFTAKVTSWPYVPIEESVQSAHPRSKRDNLKYATIEADSDQTAHVRNKSYKFASFGEIRHNSKIESWLCVCREHYA